MNVDVPYFVDNPSYGGGNPSYGGGNPSYGGVSRYAMVDIDKLATLLAKYLDIRIEDEKPPANRIYYSTNKQRNYA